MKFSLFFEMQTAETDAPSQAALFHECVAQAELADAVGFHGIWAVEHHGLWGYSHSSAPEVFLAFVAGRTRRIRLGHGITLLPIPYNHPIRVAERVATLDILSGGRVDFGSGKSASSVEQGAFGVDRSHLAAQWHEAVTMIPKMWTSDIFEHHGKFFDVPPTRVLPRPVQSPHPPMFAACSGGDSAHVAGHLGLGALNFAELNEDDLRRKVLEYHRAVDACTPVSTRANRHFACTPATVVLPDDRRACEVGFRAARYFSDALVHYFAAKETPRTETRVARTAPLSDRTLQARRAARHAPDAVLSTIIGDPVCARESVSRFAAAGVDELILVMQMGTVPQAIVLESIRTFAEHVIPYFV